MAFLLYSPQWAASVFQDGVWATFFAGNWRMAISGVDHFQSTMPPSPLQHYWSLSVEEQFYFVWPWVMLAVFAIVSRDKNASRNHRLRVALFVLLALSAVSLVFSYVQTSTAPEVAYFSTPTRTWELGFGAALTFAVQWARTQPTWTRILEG